MNDILTEQAAKLVETEILADQTSLVTECFVKGVFDYEDIVNETNYISENGELVTGEALRKARQKGDFEEKHEEVFKEIFSWHLVDWLGDFLEEKGEPILRNDHGTWWGRTTFGQMIYQDWVIQKIAQEIYENPRMGK